MFTSSSAFQQQNRTSSNLSSTSMSTTPEEPLQHPKYNHLLNIPQIQSLLQTWINDDIPSYFDIGGLVVGDEPKSGTLYMKSSGVFAGKVFFDVCFELLDCKVVWEDDVAVEGQYIDCEDGKKKVKMATVYGAVNAILRGERTALNTISRCSGVASASAEGAKIAQECGWGGMVAGTRKTTPGFRLVEKYGLLVGGAATHRLDLSQMTMLKDNHIWSAGSITAAVKLARKAAGFSSKIEVECQSLEEALEAAQAGAEVVMLDNFTPTQLKIDAKTFKEQYPHVLVEASGGITNETMKDYFCEHVDVVSQGTLTQGYRCLDFSLKIDH